MIVLFCQLAKQSVTRLFQSHGYSELVPGSRPPAHALQAIKHMATMSEFFFNEVTRGSLCFLPKVLNLPDVSKLFL